jgi:hypothetical protein
MDAERENELEVIYKPKDELEGRILEGVLQGENIPCYLRSRQIPWMDDIMELVEGFWGDLLVPRYAAEQARQIIHAYLEEKESP